MPSIHACQLQQLCAQQLSANNTHICRQGCDMEQGFVGHGSRHMMVCLLHDALSTACLLHACSMMHCLLHCAVKGGGPQNVLSLDQAKGVLTSWQCNQVDMLMHTLLSNCSCTLSVQPRSASSSVLAALLTALLGLTMVDAPCLEPEPSPNSET